MPFRLDEYDAAYGRFMSEAVYALAMAGSPLLSTLAPMEKSPGALGSAIQTGDGQVVDLPAASLTATHSFERQALVSGDADALLDGLAATAEQFAAGLEAALISTLQVVTDATGNTVDAAGRNNIDALIESFDKLEFSLDDDGELVLPTLIVNPADLEAFSRPTPEQKQRISEVLSRKKDELAARQRSRRIPRHRI